jgi:hypothetical protein
MKKQININPFITFFVIVAAIIVILTIIFYPKNLPFWQFSVWDVVILLVSLTLIATFIERAVEVVIIVCRERTKQSMLTAVNMAKLKVGLKLKKGATEFTVDEKQATEELENYKAATKSLALPIAFAFGIAISAVGIRVLQPLVDPAVFRQLTTLQKSLFTGIDTFITGALLGGGSKGMHEIVEAFLNTVEKYRRNLKKDVK